jgi:hypothetical protein
MARGDVARRRAGCSEDGLVTFDPALKRGTISCGDGVVADGVRPSPRRRGSGVLRVEGRALQFWGGGIKERIVNQRDGAASHGK